MTDLFEKLAVLADELDKIAALEVADEVDALMQDLKSEVSRRAEEEDTHMSVCPECDGSGTGIDSPWCSMCKGEGFVKGAALNKIALKPPYVRRRGNKWVVLDKHTGKVLSEHDPKEQANGSLAAMHMHKG